VIIRIIPAEEAVFGKLGAFQGSTEDFEGLDFRFNFVRTAVKTIEPQLRLLQ